MPFAFNTWKSYIMYFDSSVSNL